MASEAAKTFSESEMIKGVASVSLYYSINDDMSRITAGAHPFPLARSRTAVAPRDERSSAGGRHDGRRGGEGEREETRRDVSTRSRRAVDEAQQHQPPHTSRSHSTRTPTTHRDLRPITTSLPSSHRTVALPTTPSLRHRPSNPSRTHSSSSSSQSSISSASSGASESSSSESPVQATNATTSWKDWAMGRGRRETEEEEKGEVVEGLEKKEDLSDLIAEPQKSTLWNLVSTVAHAAIHRGGAGESEFIGDDDGPPTPTGGEGKLERAMKKWYVENASSRSDLPDWLFPPSALAPPPPPPPTVEPTNSSLRSSNDSVSRSRSFSSPAQPPRNLLRDIYDSAPPLPTARRAAVPLSTGGASSSGGGRATERLKAMRLERAPTRLREPEPMIVHEEPMSRRSAGRRDDERGGGGREERRRPVGLPSAPGGLPSGPEGRRAAGKF